MDLVGKNVLIVIGQYYTKYGQCDTTYTFTANFLKPQPLDPGGRRCNSLYSRICGAPAVCYVLMAKQRRMKVNFAPLTRRREIRH